MEKIAVKEVVEFNRKSDRSRKSFGVKLKNKRPKTEIEKSEGGDYWISSSSTIGNVFKRNNASLIEEKIDVLDGKIADTDSDRTKAQYQRNRDILSNFREFDFSNIRPSGSRLTFHKKPKEKSILTLNGLPIYINPSHVYSFEQDGKKLIGAVWFVTKLDGYKKAELGVFTDALQRYLIEHFATEFEVSLSDCIVVDAFNGGVVTYQDLKSNGGASLLSKLTQEISLLN